MTWQSLVTGRRTDFNGFGANRSERGAGRIVQGWLACGSGDSSEKRPEGLEQFFTIATAESQFRAIVQLDNIVPMKNRLQLANAVKIDKRGAMDTQKFFRV